MFGSCASSRNSYPKKILNSKVDKIVTNALKYKGVKYKFGGTTKRGIDCSGILYIAFGQENI
jgi:cell wall-associated NlpC family hydrolase